MRIVWDERKRLANLRTHGLNFGAVEAEFFDNCVITGAKQGRFMAVGRWEDTLISVVFSRLGSEAISIISMRRASRKERRQYGQA